MLKFILPHLSYLSWTFQFGNLNFSRISATIKTLKAKIYKTYTKTKYLANDGRLKLCNIGLSESTKTLIEKWNKDYVEIISLNIGHHFPPDLLTILYVFSIFDATQISSKNGQQFKIYVQAEINEIAYHFFKENFEDGNKLLQQWKIMNIEWTLGSISKASWR